MKLCYLLIATVGVLASAQDVQDYNSDYDNFYDYDALKEEGDKIEAELDKLDAQSDLKVKEDIEKFENENLEYLEPKDDVESINDYQFEDNRDKPKDLEDRKDVPADNDGSFEGRDDTFDDLALDTVDEIEKKKQADQADYALLWGDDSVAPLPVPQPAETSQEDKDIIEETRQLLDNDGDDFEEEIQKAIENFETFSDNKPNDEMIEKNEQILDADFEDLVLDEDINKPDDKIIEETKKILDRTNDSFNNDEQDKNDEIIQDEVNPEVKDTSINKQDPTVERIQDDQVINESKNEKQEIDVEEDSVDKAYADLNEDLDKLFETLDKLSKDSSEKEKIEDEVFDKLDDHFFKEDENINVEGSEELVDDAKDDTDYEDVDFDNIMNGIMNENDMGANNPNAEVNPNQLLNDELSKPNPDDVFEKDAEIIDDKAEPILFLDAIVDGEPKNAESLEVNDNDNNAEAASVELEKVPETVDINILNSQELDDLMKQFSAAHSADLDVHSESFDQNVAPIHITLNADEPVVVTSPNYPSAYPTNNIVDWVFDGEGMGIELNITDFMVNGALGDYLLIKPGGVDETGHAGLMFTYRLNSEKRFRFTDVDRMFVRFESKPGMMFMRGFQFSVKMIAPLPEDTEPVPEPEPVVEAPHSTATLHLAMSVSQFQDVKEDFRLLLADMAATYIRLNDIDPGLNSTSEVTQITSVSACPVTWPNYEHCAAVTFGIPLANEDPDEDAKMLRAEDLVDMWMTLKTKDPYVLRLGQMGISEFQRPSSSVLTAWLVIASGVLISMAMLAVVLWRFSCFEDYTRMKTFSDTDSLHNEKRGLDLYPTPHQTLPPLFAENEYKWPEHDDTTRVDMGGFANKNYARDMYDIDSDEEVITPRTGAVTARDVYGGSNA